MTESNGSVAAEPMPVLVIRPSRGWRALGLRELWAYRELLWIFAWRDLKVRYRQTFLGAVWVMGQPLITMAIFTLIFNRVAHLRASGNVPYSVFVLSGLLLWNFFSASVAHAGNSLIGASYLISKVYFPRLAIPLAATIVDLVDLSVSAVLLAALMIWYRVLPGPEIVLFPVVVLAGAVLATGVGLWCAALNVEYRDVRVLIPFVLQLGMFATPVAYSVDVIPAKYRFLVLLNPMTGIIEAGRATLFGTPVAMEALLSAAIVSPLVLITGIYYYRRMERLFADLL
ncbi:MAG: ABC transporter permease [Acidobacteria bacterium]|nr:ABC transporter permease [Acidobacteriota bacterium]MBV9477495.1 ABC transporter permease [Acidobacteriota bacterium]